MNWKSVYMVITYIEWGILIGESILTFRIVYTIFNMIFFSEEKNGVGAVWIKVRKQAMAAILMVCVVNIVELIKSYFFHV